MEQELLFLSVTFWFSALSPHLTLQNVLLYQITTLTAFLTPFWQLLLLMLGTGHIVRKYDFGLKYFRQMTRRERPLISL